MSHRHPSTLHHSYVMPQSLTPPSADTCHHQSASCCTQGTHPTHHVYSPSRSASRAVSTAHPPKKSSFESGRKRGRSTDEDRMIFERPSFDPRPSSHRRTVSMTTSGRSSDVGSISAEPHPFWFSNEVARTGPPMFAYPFMGCLLRSPIPAPPPSRRSSSHKKSISPTSRMPESSKDRTVQSSNQMSAFIHREHIQNVNPGQSPERYPVYERGRTSVPGLMDFANTAPRTVSGLPKNPSHTHTGLDSHHPYPSPPKSRSDRSSAHTLDHSPQSSTTLPQSSPLFMFNPIDPHLPLPSPSRRQFVSGPDHSRSLENHPPPNFKRRRTTSQSNPPHSSSSSRSSAHANQISVSDRTSRKSNKHRALPPPRPCSPPLTKPTPFSTEPHIISPYKGSNMDRNIYALPSPMFSQGPKFMTEHAFDHRYRYSLPQVNQFRRQTQSNSNGNSNVSAESLDLMNEHRSEHESPQDVCLPSFELLLNGIQEMRMREQSGGSTGMTIMDAI